MKYRFFLTIIMLFILSSSVYAKENNDLIGYGKTTWGMSPEEVLKVEPRAELIKNPEKLSSGNFTEGIALVKISEIIILEEKYNVVFLFNKSSKKLVHVIIRSQLLPTSIIQDLFQNIEKLLTEKYGNPTYKSPMQNISWKFPGTKIELIFAKINILSSAKVEINYMPSKIDENNTSDL